MLKEKQGPGIVVIPFYPDNEKINGYPPKERESNELKFNFILSLKELEEIQEEIMTICEAIDNTIEETKTNIVAKRNGIMEIPPAGIIVDRDEGR